MPAVRERVSHLQAEFLDRYLSTGNATQAWLDTYQRDIGTTEQRPALSRNAAAVRASQTLRSPAVSKALAKTIQARRDMLLLPTEGDVLQAYGQALRFDPASLYDAEGNPLPVHLIPEHTRKALEGIDIKETIVEPKDGQGEIRRYTTYRYKYPDKLRACESLARILAMGGLAPQMPQATTQTTVNVQVNSFGQDEAKRLLDMFSPKPAVEPEQPETLSIPLESLDNEKE